FRPAMLVPARDSGPPASSAVWFVSSLFLPQPKKNTAGGGVITHHASSLRWYYPHQVQTVGGVPWPPSQPGFPSSRTDTVQFVRAKHRSQEKARKKSCTLRPQSAM